MLARRTQYRDREGVCLFSVPRRVFSASRKSQRRTQHPTRPWRRPPTTVRFRAAAPRRPRAPRVIHRFVEVPPVPNNEWPIHHLRRTHTHVPILTKGGCSAWRTHERQRRVRVQRVHPSENRESFVGGNAVFREARTSQRALRAARKTRMAFVDHVAQRPAAPATRFNGGSAQRRATSGAPPVKTALYNQARAAAHPMPRSNGWQAS